MDEPLKEKKSEEVEIKLPIEFDIAGGCFAVGLFASAIAFLCWLVGWPTGIGIFGFVAFLAFVSGVIILPGPWAQDARSLAQSDKELNDRIVGANLEEIWRQYRQGKSIKQIAAEYHVSQASVRRGLKRKRVD